MTSTNIGTRLFPNITFLHDCTVKKWIIGGRANQSGTGFPELQIWRPNANKTLYTKISSYPITYLNTSTYSNVYEYYPLDSQYIKKGDMLGLFQPRNQSLLNFYYQINTGSLNYIVLEPTPQNKIMISDASVINQYPLITAVVQEYTQSTTDSSLNTATAEQVITFTAFITNTPSINNDVKYGNNVLSIIAITISGIILITNSICIVGVCVLVYQSKRKCHTSQINPSSQMEFTAMDRILSTSEASQDSRQSMQENPLYHHSKVYKDIYYDSNPKVSPYVVPKVTPYAVSNIEPKEWSFQNCPDGFLIK